MLAQRAEGAMAAMEVVPVSVRTLVAARALIAYLGKIVLPVGLIPFYPYPQDVSLFSFAYLSATGLLIVITIACAVIAKKQRIWPAVWGYYVATLIPVIGIVQVGGQSMADRYAYLPSLGPFMVMGVMAAALSEKAGREQLRGPAIFRAAVLLVLVILSSLTVRQITVWRTSLDLWNDVINKEPDKAPLAYYNRGQVFMNGGRFDRAIEDYSMAITLNPRYLEAFYNRGVAFDNLGRVEQAIADYEKAISLDPTSYQALNNLGILYGRTGSSQKAIASFSKAVDVRPEYPGSYLNRGVTYFLAGRREDAVADLNKAIALDPQFAPAYLQRGKLFLSTGSREAANADFRKACELGIQEACSAMP
jgi:tetratricopeptide (TPR) repeat protein